ncbi:hypothetical protein JW992_05245 [candidate division KSB1 bacterium]|nr:hypothetical protein [candidate division KSB1 bacterium]
MSKHLHYAVREPTKPIFITDPVRDIVQKSGFTQGWVLISAGKEHVSISVLDKDSPQIHPVKSDNNGADKALHTEKLSQADCRLAYRTVLPIRANHVALPPNGEIVLVAPPQIESVDVLVKVLNKD